MILLHNTPDDNLEHGACPHCNSALSISFTSVVDSLKKLRLLLNGSLNTTNCHECGESIILQEPVLVNMESHGIEHMLYMPLCYLEKGYYPAEEFVASDDIGRIFFSLDELASQVRARILIDQLPIELPVRDYAPRAQAITGNHRKSDHTDPRSTGTEN